jgi:hypothetical protein
MAKRTAGTKTGGSDKEAPSDEALLVRRHLSLGWWTLAFFATFGLVLEAAHGLKLGWYVDLSNATRRLCFTLGHAHGTLLGFLNLAFGLCLPHAKLSRPAAARASFALMAATVLMPLGFILGGASFYAGDPGLAIVLVPPGGAILVYALVVMARGFSLRR